jgi:hypothetical protein
MFDQCADESDGPKLKNRLSYPVKDCRPVHKPVFCKNQSLPGMRRSEEISKQGSLHKTLCGIRQTHDGIFGIVQDSIELH